MMSRYDSAGMLSSHLIESRRRYIRVLRGLTPSARVEKAFELTEFTRRLAWDGLRARHPDYSQEELRRRYLHHLQRCHNANF